MKINLLDVKFAFGYLGALIGTGTQAILFDWDFARTLITFVLTCITTAVIITLIDREIDKKL